MILYLIFKFPKIIKIKIKQRIKKFLMIWTNNNNNYKKKIKIIINLIMSINQIIIRLIQIKSKKIIKKLYNKTLIFLNKIHNSKINKAQLKHIK